MYVPIWLFLASLLLVGWQVYRYCQFKQKAQAAEREWKAKARPDPDNYRLRPRGATSVWCQRSAARSSGSGHIKRKILAWLAVLAALGIGARRGLHVGRRVVLHHTTEEIAKLLAKGGGARWHEERAARLRGQHGLTEQQHRDLAFHEESAAAIRRTAEAWGSPELADR